MTNTQRYLLISGLLLLFSTIIGYMGLGPTAVSSLFGPWLFFDSAQTLFNLSLAIICLLSFKLAHTDRWLRVMSGLMGVVTLVVAVIGFLNMHTPLPSANFFNLELADTLMYLVLALAGFWVAFMPEGPMFVREDQSIKATAKPIA